MECIAWEEEDRQLIYIRLSLGKRLLLADNFLLPCGIFSLRSSTVVLCPSIVDSLHTLLT